MSRQSLFRWSLILLVAMVGLIICPYGQNSMPILSAAEDQPSPLIWAASVNVSQTEGESRAPALAADGQGTVHVVWEERRYVYHSYLRQGTWSLPWRVATGEQPAIAIDHNNVPHLVFVNEFRGNYEIYHCQWNGTSWTLPVNVSNTSGVSAIPDISIDAHNTPHVTWTDNSLGYNVIYHAVWNGTFWLPRPIEQARGSVSAIAVGNDDIVHVVWQDRDSLEDPYEVYHVQWDGERWSLPENISDSGNASTIPDIAVGEDGVTHIIWEEEVNGTNQVYYSYGKSPLWSFQEDISQSESNCYLPVIIVDRDGFPHLAWDEFDQLSYAWRPSSASWIESDRVSKNPDGIADVALFAGSQGRIHAAWAERLPDGNWDVFYSAHASFMRYHASLPLIVGNGGE